MALILNANPVGVYPKAINLRRDGRVCNPPSTVKFFSLCVESRMAVILKANPVGVYPKSLDYGQNHPRINCGLID